MLKTFIKIIRILFEMDDNDADRNYSKYSRGYSSYKAWLCTPDAWRQGYFAYELQSYISILDTRRSYGKRKESRIFGRDR